MALHFPSRYDNESSLWTLAQVKPGQFAQVQVKVRAARIVFRPRRMLVVEVEDETGEAVLRYLHFKDNQRHSFTPGLQLRVLGDVRRSLAGIEFVHPRIRTGWLSASEIAAQPLVPVYPTTSGLSQLALRKIVRQALTESLPKEWLPLEFLREHGLMPLPEAIRLLHFPPADAAQTGLLAELSSQQGPAWDRIRLDELLAQQLALRKARQRRGAEQAQALSNVTLVDRLIKGLPFKLTPAQLHVWNEISTDLSRSVPMHRLLQGDVGSGKTVIAALAALQAVGSGVQVAVMAPTEILAEQLFRKFSEWLSALDVSCALLKGGQPVAQRRETLSQLRTGALSLVVGTHALIQKDVSFQNLGLAIVDEQHRFGVGQRLALRVSHEGAAVDETAIVPHVLGMSATPIPRSLAMTYLADLDVSVLHERPPGRQPIVTKLMSASRREELVERVRQFVSEGGQAYWVCPVIEQSESSDKESDRALQAIETAQAMLAPVLGDQLAVVHGRMTTEEKTQAMHSFAEGRRRLLLATTVIEVGVDVPQASLMVIEHAERFGLAQLHQLRGRVGRGSASSTCILIFEEPLSELARERLKTLYETDDGFEVARRDLALRGPGEFLGIRQSGVPSLRYCDLERDSRWVELAVAFGAKLALAEASGSQLRALGFAPESLRELVDRWAHNKDLLLASG